MNDSLQKGMITLVQSALTGKTLPLPDDFDLASAEKLIRNHQIGSLIYEGAIRCKVDPHLPIMQKLQHITYQSMHVDANQQRLLTEVLGAFDENGIAYMPLKGILLKPLYPRSDMRTMSDADILINLEQYDNIRPLMAGLGFAEKLESDHELVWTKSCLYLELHKRLIPSYNKDYAAYFGDGWKLAQPCGDSSTRHEMTAEDQLLYLFIHFAKHYRDGGIGIRHMVDLYVYKRANPQLDETYIAQELKKLQVYDFYRNICHTLGVWFENDAPSEKSRLITNAVFDSGSYGTKADSLAANGVRLMADGDSAKVVWQKQLLQMIFPSRQVLCKRYPILKTLPVLLPVMWILRWISGVFCRRENIRLQQNRLQMMQEDRINRYRQALEAVDLSFHFEE